MPQADELSFGETLREAIRDSGRSQNSIAKAAGVPQGAISVFMAGGGLRLDSFEHLCLEVGVTLKPPRKRPRRPNRD